MLVQISIGIKGKYSDRELNVSVFHRNKKKLKIRN